MKFGGIEELKMMDVVSQSRAWAVAGVPFPHKWPAALPDWLPHVWGKVGLYVIPSSFRIVAESGERS
jgi:hypothetical protein